MRRIAVLSCSALLALGLAACGDDDDGAATPPTPTAATSETPAASPSETSGGGEAPPVTGAVEIGMKDLKFEPAEAEVKVGQLVRWTNNEAIPHNAVAKDDQFKSEIFNEGKTFEYTPDKPGTIEYVCTLHSGMEGTLEVVE